MSEITFRNIYQDTLKLYTDAEKAFAEFVATTPMHGSATKVYAFVQANADVVFWAVNLFHAFFSPFAYTVGLAAGSACTLAKRLEKTQVNIGIISSTAQEAAKNKAKFAIVSAITTLFFKAILRGFLSGFASGCELTNATTQKLSLQQQRRTMWEHLSLLLRE